jgi:hypothetical protein
MFVLTYFKKDTMESVAIVVIHETLNNKLTLNVLKLYCLGDGGGGREFLNR